MSVFAVTAGGAKEGLVPGTMSSLPGMVACLVVGQEGGLHFSRGAFVSFVGHRNLLGSIIAVAPQMVVEKLGRGEPSYVRAAGAALTSIMGRMLDAQYCAGSGRRRF